MDYSLHYKKLIESRKSRALISGCYYEKHHIIMKSMGGSDDDSNLVFLTAREHFLAHWLLWRWHRNSQTAFAFHMMQKRRKNQKKHFSSIAYAEGKEAASIAMKGKSPMQGRKMSQDHIQRRVESRRKTVSKPGYQVSEKFRNSISNAMKGDKNPMHGTSFYEKWVEKYGKEEADRRKREMYLTRKLTLSRKRTGKFAEKAFLAISETGEKFLIDGKVITVLHFCQKFNLSYTKISELILNGKCSIFRKISDNYKGWKIYENHNHADDDI